MQIVGSHPLADEWPIREDVLEAITESIRANGLRQPIVVTPDGLIIDGRTRYRACLSLGIAPDVLIYEGDDILEYVLDANAGRRHEPAGVRALIVARSLIAAGRREGGRFAYGQIRNGKSFTKSFQVQVSNAALILDYVPSLADVVISKSMTFEAAYDQAVAKRDKAARDAASAAQREEEETGARDFIEREAPDLAARVNGDDLQSYAEALSIWELRNREEADRIRAEKAEAARKSAEHAKAMTDFYTGMALGLQSVGGNGQYTDIHKVMAEFSPSYLNPPQLEREFAVENLRSGVRFLSALIEWQEAR